VEARVPRGVAIPELKNQLFQAAERLLVRDGPAALSSRAITTEAGCAKGVLHNHFADLDDFLTEFVLDRFRLATQHAADLPAKAGQATVAHNLTDAAASLFGSNALALTTVVMSRPSLAARIHEKANHAGSPKLPDLERIVATYLNAEKELGRVAADADTEAAALALLATAHHLFITHRTSTPDPHQRLRRVVDILIAGTVPSDNPTATGAHETDP
jgi:AcrR family transcriptional regulator